MSPIGRGPTEKEKNTGLKVLLYSVLTTRGRSAVLREASKEWEVEDLRIILELRLFFWGGVTNMSCFAKDVLNRLGTA